MKFIVKHGKNLPKDTDMENYEFCWSTNLYGLYIKSGDGELVCLNDLSEYPLKEGEVTYLKAKLSDKVSLIYLSDTLSLAIASDGTNKVLKLISESDEAYHLKTWVTAQGLIGDETVCYSDTSDTNETVGDSSVVLPLDLGTYSILNADVRYLVNEKDYYKVNLDYSNKMNHIRVTVERLAANLELGGN